MEHRKPGYVWDEEARKFSRKVGTQSQVSGSGYSMLQLAWPEECFVLAEEDPQRKPEERKHDPPGGPRAVITTSALDYLSARGAKWLLSRHLNDLGLFQFENGNSSLLDLDALAYTELLNTSTGANMVVQVEVVPSKRRIPGMDG